MKVAATVKFNRFPEIARRLPAATAKVVETSARVIEADVKERMAQEAGGRVYDLGNGIMHQASAPGDYPAIETGALANSVTAEAMNGEKTSWLVGTDVEYAEFLEYGTVRMAARPFMTPSAERERPEFVRRMENLERELR